MKTKLLLALPALLALSLPAFAAPAKAAKSKSPAVAEKVPAAKTYSAELIINPAQFGPDSTLELRFPTPMIPEDKVGTFATESPLVSVPPLAGEFEWTSTRSGIHRLKETPKFDSSYRFELRAGVKDLEGHAVRAEKLRDVESERFRIVDQYPKWYSRNDIVRTPTFLLEFNDAVTPEAAAAGMAFKCAEGNQRIEVSARAATGADFIRYGADPKPTWAEQVAKQTPQVEREAVRASAVIVRPATPLNVGKEWILDIATSIVNADGTSKLAAGDAVKVGTVIPFLVEKVSAHSPFDAPRYITVDFSRSLMPGFNGTPEEVKAAQAKRVAELATQISVQPAVAGLKHEVDGTLVHVEGGFELGRDYTLTVDAALQSGDGLPLPAGVSETLRFEANPPYVSAPAFVNPQLAAGAGDYEFAAANVTGVEIRAKLLKGSELLQAVDLYQPYINASNGDDKKRGEFNPLPLDDYPGEVIFERKLTFDKPLDQSSVFKLNWKEILGQRPAGSLFIEVTGTAMEGAPGGETVIAQSLIEFTDIGLFQKDNFKSSTIFAVSLTTGKPISGVRVTVVNEDQKLLGYGDTDANGVVEVTGAKVGFILAEKNGDATAMPAGEYDTLMPLWHFDINSTYESPWKKFHRCFLFSDRPLYKPGDTAHLKALVRVENGDTLSLPKKPQTGTLKIRDPDYRVILEQDVTFNENGSWSGSYPLPAGGATGWYNVQMEFDEEGSDDESGSGFLSIRVDEYRPNSFEVKMDAAKVVIDTERIKVPLTANYLMGKPLSKAKVMWNASRTLGFEPPADFREHHFGDAPRWAHYAQDRDPEVQEEGSDELPWWDASGDLLINDDGTAMIELPAPPPHSAGLPQTVNLEAEVVDINEQTIAASAEIKVPGAPFLLGLKGPQYFATAGQPARLEAVALTPDGKPRTQDVAVNVMIERQSYNVVRVETAGVGSTIKHQVILTPELTQPAVLKSPAAGQAAMLALDFTPKAGGTYFLTVKSQDPSAPELLSRMPFWSMGGGEFPWAMNDGARITLQPEKTSYKPGEEATILVKTPISGDALVTVERNRVQRHFRTSVSPDNPLIKVKLEDEDAPNVFVSVTIIRGAQDSTQKVKMPEYRLGYCELTVESAANSLAIDLKPDRDTVRPAEQVTATAVIKDHTGKPVPGADVTVWAVDEGVLSLMGFVTPDPLEFFHSPDPLAVRSRTNFETLLTEDASQRYRGNKGFVIGGGGDENLGEIAARKNFVATALWSASLTTNEQGVATASFTAPDNLSRFRLMAVAASGAVLFGSAESSVTINKPLMLEPAVPRFARLEDEFLLKGIVHNTTPHSGTVNVTLTLDDHAEFITEERAFILTALAAAKDKPQGKVWSRTISLKPMETTSVAFPVKFTKVGALKWTWQAKTLTWSDATPQADKVESTFEVEHPVPENREVRYFRLAGNALPDNLIKDLDPVLLEGDGQLTLTASTSQLYDVRDALDYVLTYPYGCVEQTSSSTLPWLALGGFGELFPEHLNREKTKVAVQTGVNRLLQMVTDNGGLGYWPGAQEPSFWGSAYGGFILLKAVDAGAQVPQEVISELLDYLSKELRHLDDEKSAYVLTDACMAVYTLAKGGKAEPAYHTLLYNHRDRIPTRGKLFLALAMLVNGDNEEQVKTLLGVQPKPPVAKADSKKKKANTPSRPITPTAPGGFVDWFGDRVNTALKLIAFTHLGLKEEADAAVDKILASRNRNGEWGNTFTNAWTLQAMVAYERSLKAKPGPVAVDLAWGEVKQRIQLPQPTSIGKGQFQLTQVLSAQPLTLAIPADRQVIVRLEAKSRSKLRDFAGANHGYSLVRSYHKYNPDGSLSPIDDLRVGDQVLVRLEIDAPGSDRYLAINDPLPGVFEAINPEFKTQNADTRPIGELEEWFCDHRELRTDRALFFTDQSPGRGKFGLAYLARVIAEGDVIAPSARIEAMYEPEKNGISSTARIRTLPAAAGGSVVRE